MIVANLAGQILRSFPQALNVSLFQRAAKSIDLSLKRRRRIAMVLGLFACRSGLLAERLLVWRTFGKLARRVFFLLGFVFLLALVFEFFLKGRFFFIRDALHLFEHLTDAFGHAFGADRSPVELVLHFGRQIVSLRAHDSGLLRLLHLIEQIHQFAKFAENRSGLTANLAGPAPRLEPFEQALERHLNFSLVAFGSCQRRLARLARLLSRHAQERFDGPEFFFSQATQISFEGAGALCRGRMRQMIVEDRLFHPSRLGEQALIRRVDTGSDLLLHHLGLSQRSKSSRRKALDC